MSKTITLRIWNEQEGRVTKTVEVKNVISVEFASKYCPGIDFIEEDIEIFIVPGLIDIEFNFSEDKEYVFLTVKDCEEQ